MCEFPSSMLRIDKKYAFVFIRGKHCDALRTTDEREDEKRWKFYDKYLNKNPRRRSPRTPLYRNGFLFNFSSLWDFPLKQITFIAAG